MPEESWEKLGISNDFIFGKVMRDPELCRELLETILGESIDHVEYPEEQKTIGITKDARKQHCRREAAIIRV